jgi:predicted exporter
MRWDLDNVARLQSNRRQFLPREAAGSRPSALRLKFSERCVLRLAAAAYSVAYPTVSAATQRIVDEMTVPTDVTGVNEERTKEQKSLATQYRRDHPQ